MTNHTAFTVSPRHSASMPMANAPASATTTQTSAATIFMIPPLPTSRPSLPAAQVDRPGVDHLIARHQIHALVVGDGRIDVRRRDAHPGADRQRLLGPEGGVLVRAEPHRAAGDGRIA